MRQDASVRRIAHEQMSQITDGPGSVLAPAMGVRGLDGAGQPHGQLFPDEDRVAGGPGLELLLEDLDVVHGPSQPASVRGPPP